MCYLICVKYSMKCTVFLCFTHFSYITLSDLDSEVTVVIRNEQKGVIYIIWKTNFSAIFWAKFMLTFHDLLNNWLQLILWLWLKNSNIPHIKTKTCGHHIFFLCWSICLEFSASRNLTRSLFSQQLHFSPFFSFLMLLC